MNNRDFEIIIVGAGIAGLSTALGLAQLGYKILLIDAKAAPSNELGAEFDQRVYAINLASIALLTQLGAWQELEQLRYCDYTDMRIFAKARELHFGCELLARNRLGAIVEQQALQVALSRRAANYAANLTFSWQSPLAAINFANDCAELLLADGRKLSADLIIAADGANSSCRELAGISYNSHDYAQQALVANVACEYRHHNTAWQRFLQSGPLAFLPLADNSLYPEANGKLCSIVYSADNARAAELSELDAQSFGEQLAGAMQFKLGNVQVLGPRAQFALISRHSHSYVRANMLLLGDAAHNAHPLAGQGLNMGLQDVAVLLDELGKARSLQSRAPLLRYQRRRHLANSLDVNAMSAIKYIFSYNNDFSGALLETGIGALDNLSLIKAQLARHASGL